MRALINGPLRVGAVFPQLEIGNDPADIARYFQTVEMLGFDHVAAFDHVLGADRQRPGGWSGLYDTDDPFHEVMVLLAFAAGITSRLELVTGVLVLPQRQTALVAKQAAEIDALSGHRLRLGVGIGWNIVEFISLGASFPDRAWRMEEQISLLRALWTERSVQLRGRWHEVDRAGLLPRPSAPIPVWIGGTADPAVRRAARIADGWFAILRAGQEGEEQLRSFFNYVVAAGRDPRTVGVEAWLRCTDESGWRSSLERLVRSGVTHVGLNTMGVLLTDLDSHLEALAQFLQLARSLP